jgi:hypothetical protein
MVVVVVGCWRDDGGLLAGCWQDVGRMLAGCWWDVAEYWRDVGGTLVESEADGARGTMVFVRKIARECD